MVCGGFTCSKNALCSLNVVYMLVGLLLIGVAAWGKGFGIVSRIHIIEGVIAVGVFLLIIGIVGLIGALSHHQVMLFFYMVILFLVFLFQFGVSCSCLAMNREQQEKVLNATWRRMLNKTRIDLENNLDCCGLFNSSEDAQYMSDLKLCLADCKTKNNCKNCGPKMLEHSAEALKILGGVGLFFSFTEVSLLYLDHNTVPCLQVFFLLFEEASEKMFYLTCHMIFLYSYRYWVYGLLHVIGTRKTPEQTLVLFYKPASAHDGCFNETCW
ncbi:tetraspanin-31 [Arapaima gigas]